MHSEVTDFWHRGISSIKFLSYSTSSAALSNAINSDSIVEHAIHVCLDDFQHTSPSPSVNT